MLRVFAIVESDIWLNPKNIGLVGAINKVFYATLRTDALKQRRLMVLTGPPNNGEENHVSTRRICKSGHFQHNAED